MQMFMGEIDLELQLVTLHGFRRFRDQTPIRTNGKLVALLGPNEAGKTSILNAISMIGNDEAIPKHDLSRGMKIPDDQNIITAKFRLDHDDLEAAKLTTPTWYILSKRKDGSQIYGFEPAIRKRDISNRNKLLGILQKIRKNNRLWGRLIENNESVIAHFDNAQKILNTSIETIKDEQLEELEELSRYISNSAIDSDPKYFKSLSNHIDSQIQIENEQTPE
ncbi:MAG: AAA family ATPase [Novosphingobium sp.]